ncbi:MAG: hypothetical protein HY876_05115 [Coriobacteriales bacterium]|nr:hypothetical protein [Coriobacteriales bacterium]
MTEILSNPYVAALCGVLVGFACIAGIAASPKIMRSGGTAAATGVMMGAMALSMIVILTLLLLYVFVALDGFLWFGISLAGGFVAGLVLMSVRLVRGVEPEDQGR